MKHRRNIKILIIFFTLFLTASILIKFRNSITSLNIADLKNMILECGQYSFLVFILLYTVKPVILILPTAVLAIAAGSIYGPFIGSIVNLIGCFISATICFYLSRFMGSGFLDKLLKGKALKLDSNIEKHGFKIMTIMRLSIIFPFDALSYAAGITKMKYRDFIAGTMLGFLPEMISYAYAGENLSNPLSFKFIAPFVVILIMSLMFSSILKKLRRDT